jgi:RND family efflux transporter MFP subunit
MTRQLLWLLAGLLLLAGCGKPASEAPAAAGSTATNAAATNAAATNMASPAPAAKPALAVKAVAPQTLDWPYTLKAAGNIAAWQEAVIGAEVSNYRLTDVLVNVGDRVKKGQALARIDPETLESELAETRATVAEAEATLAEARANHERARQLTAKGFYSAQQNTQTQTAADTALARLNAARARLQSAELKRAKAAILAPDDGVISARTATVGTPTQAGQELFRLIRGGRLEWRAEVTAAELAKLRPGLVAVLVGPDGGEVRGSLRIVAPTVDPQTRNALVYVDLPAQAPLSAGMFVRGEFLLDRAPALTLPQSALLLQEGFAYVFRIEGGEIAKVHQIKIGMGRRQGDRVEVSGLDADARVVESGAGLLADGDTVRVVTTEETPPATAATTGATSGN